MDDEFGSDGDFLALATAVEQGSSNTNSAPQASSSSSSSLPGAQPKPKVTQPTPQVIARPSGPSAILVSPRQKGNPVLNNIKSVAWEYSDIPADYVLGTTTCALFLSLKYHRLHPEYIYQRIKHLAGKYNLRVLLTMVDIDNHEEPLRELAKTSLVNNLTLILAWSAREAARYLEAYKVLENASPTGIRGQQAMTYAERMVEFVTTPRGINKADAVGIVSAFGSVRAAVNARKEEIATVQGWGEVKVKRWYDTVREPFRIENTAKKTSDSNKASTAIPISSIHTGAGKVNETTATGSANTAHNEPHKESGIPNEDEEEALRMLEESERFDDRDPIQQQALKRSRVEEPELSESMQAALAKYRT
jgi:DNA excision repair protein ERCC-1